MSRRLSLRCFPARCRAPSTWRRARPVAVKEVVSRLAQLAGRPDLLRLGALPAPLEPPRLEASISRLRDEIGWKPALDLGAGLQHALDFWRAALDEEKRSPVASHRANWNQVVSYCH